MRPLASTKVRLNGKKLNVIDWTMLKKINKKITENTLKKKKAFKLLYLEKMETVVHRKEKSSVFQDPQFLNQLCYNGK